jgi:N4-bis(aminopropyl)spermidine synthase
MAAMDLRQALNAVSDVVNNRPRALREFDQIYMKSADMLLQTEHVSRHLDKKRVIFIGDGDAIALCLVHLKKLNLLQRGPISVHVLDFDERVVKSIRRFAKEWEIEGQVTAELYNVAEALPDRLWQKFEGFYTNPPFGQRNDGKSIRAFVRRGFEAMAGTDSTGCVVIADDPKVPWTQRVLLSTQKFAIDSGYLVAECMPAFHAYHLDDSPDLLSCSMILRSIADNSSHYSSAPILKEDRVSFYGTDKNLEVRFVRDNSEYGEDLLQNYSLERYSFDQINLNI